MLEMSSHNNCIPCGRSNFTLAACACDARKYNLFLWKQVTVNQLDVHATSGRKGGGYVDVITQVPTPQEFEYVKFGRFDNESSMLTILKDTQEAYPDVPVLALGAT